MTYNDLPQHFLMHRLKDVWRGGTLLGHAFDIIPPCSAALLTPVCRSQKVSISLRATQPAEFFLISISAFQVIAAISWSIWLTEKRKQLVFAACLNFRMRASPGSPHLLDASQPPSTHPIFLHMADSSAASFHNYSCIFLRFALLFQYTYVAFQSPSPCSRSLVVIHSHHHLQCFHPR